jgi:hypothetical protein
MGDFVRLSRKSTRIPSLIVQIFTKQLGRGGEMSGQLARAGIQFSTSPAAVKISTSAGDETVVSSGSP